MNCIVYDFKKLKESNSTAYEFELGKSIAKNSWHLHNAF